MVPPWPREAIRPEEKVWVIILTVLGLGVVEKKVPPHPSPYKWLQCGERLRSQSLGAPQASTTAVCAAGMREGSQSNRI